MWEQLFLWSLTKKFLFQKLEYIFKYVFKSSLTVYLFYITKFQGMAPDPFVDFTTDPGLWFDKWFIWDIISVMERLYKEISILYFVV